MLTYLQSGCSRNAQACNSYQYMRPNAKHGHRCDYSALLSWFINDLQHASHLPGRHHFVLHLISAAAHINDICRSLHIQPSGHCMSTRVSLEQSVSGQRRGRNSVHSEKSALLWVQIDTRPSMAIPIAHRRCPRLRDDIGFLGALCATVACPIAHHSCVEYGSEYRFGRCRGWCCRFNV